MLKFYITKKKGLKFQERNIVVQCILTMAKFHSPT